MRDFSHWDFAETFSARQAAALILGYEPEEAWQDKGVLGRRVGIVYERLLHDFSQAVGRVKTEILKGKPGRVDADLANPPGALLSVELAKMLQIRTHGTEFVLWLSPLARMEAELDKQVFTRATLDGWIAHSQIASVYSFSVARAVGTTLPDATSDAASAIDIDPADLPEELSAANLAFRAVTNGYGDQGATFKTRLVQYLQEKFSFSAEAVTRISTVANPEKGAGRRKRTV